MNDRNFGWIRKHRYWNYLTLHGLGPGITINEGGAEAYNRGELLMGSDYSDPFVPNVYLRNLQATRSFATGLEFLGSNIFRLGPIYDIDYSQSVGLSFSWVQNAATTQGVVWTATVQYIPVNIIITGSEVTLFSGNLSKSFASGAAYENLWTPRLEIKGFIPSIDLLEGTFLVIQIGLVPDGAIANPLLRGVEFDYVPRRCSGDQCEVNLLRTSEV